ncbi:MAG: DEAD/DEAH box helicase [Verrucomicrobiae bacterium]|nr:DEAD/DEAH box helicase [Verrucomicrobiae bacterium]
MGFSKLGLSPKVMEGVRAAGYTDPTPIQLRAIPVILQKKDMIGSAQTGTGKTAAFTLPMLTLLGSHQPHIRCLVVTPTRELAAQVETAIRDYGRFTNLKAAVIFGGTGYGRQDEQLRQGVDIVVATPGRLLDHMERGTVRLDRVEMLILDEADRMLDMGFMPDMRRIINKCPKGRQTLLFSATIPVEIDRLSQWALRQPEKIATEAARSPAATVTHTLYPVAEDQKQDLFLELLKQTDYNQVLVFARTKYGADRLYNALRRLNHAVAVLHSGRTQSEREHSLNGFRNDRYEIMVATDIASRGLDVEGISHVINYDVPQHPEDYVHRIGRTGRAQTVGDARTIMVAEDLIHIRAIERFIGQTIPRVKLNNFPYLYTRAFDAKEPLRLKSMRVGSTYFSHSGRRRR